MKNKNFVLLGVAAAAASFVVTGFFVKPKEETANAPIAKIQNLVKFHNMSYGNAQSSVTVVEFFDPECESCRAVHPLTKKLIAEYGDRVRFVLRYMPYHKNSILAASALEEAKEIGKYDEALDILFEKQPEWGSHENPRPELIAQYLEKLGVPKDHLSDKYLLEKHSSKITEDRIDGETLGVRATPTFLINGVPVNALGEENLKQAIEAALAKK